MYHQLRLVSHFSFQLLKANPNPLTLCVPSFPIRFRSTFHACQRRRCHMSTVLEKNTGSDNYSISCHHMTMRYEGEKKRTMKVTEKTFMLLEYTTALLEDFMILQRNVHTNPFRVCIWRCFSGMHHRGTSFSFTLAAIKCFMVLAVRPGTVYFSKFLAWLWVTDLKSSSRVASLFTPLQGQTEQMICLLSFCMSSTSLL